MRSFFTVSSAVFIALSIPVSITSYEDMNGMTSSLSSSSSPMARQPMTKVFSIPRCSAARLMMQAWLLGVPRYSSLESRWASIEMTAMSSLSKFLTMGMLTVCSPPMAIVNLPSLMAGPTQKFTSSNMSSGRTKSSQFP